MIDILNAIIAGFSIVIQGILSLLPNSPFTFDILHNEYIQMMNYIIPIPAILTVTMTWLGAVAVWYVYRWVLKFTRAI